ncbi:MAG: protein kinase domain-containing protein [Thermoguttaceae bacterium]
MPASQLKGLRVGNGWTVVEAAIRKPKATGGFFSKGYIATHQDGRNGFLKAMDYTAAFQCPNTAEVLLAMTQAFVFEKTICDKCAHLSRVARAIDGGSIQVNPADPYTKVDFLIFELATGDVRSHLDMQAALDVVFIMRTLHHVATGLEQLHRADIAHQDLKPSNVLVFGKTEGSKICDLGRAWDKNMPGPFDALKIAGDRAYAPPELMYGEISTDHRSRRFGYDMYHLGSLIVFLFARVHNTALIVGNLDPMHRPAFWGGSYSEVLPFLQAASEVALDQFASHVPEFLRADMRQVVAELCNPDPMRRGHPLNRGVNQFSLQRYISLFDMLTQRARLDVVKVS